MWPELCRLCERPAANGGYRGAEVDKNKFAEWCLNFLGTTLADEIEDDDIFCYFCVWDARFYLGELQSEMCVENRTRSCNLNLRWWPDKVAEKSVQVLFESYTAGKVQQCWVPLTKALHKQKTVFSSDEKSQLEGPTFQCCYCLKTFKSKPCWRWHIKKQHADIAIRCNYHTLCCSYFKSVEDRDAHLRMVHLKPKLLKLFECIYCPMKDLRSKRNLHNHVRSKHSDVSITCQMCQMNNCLSYFKSQADLKSHFEKIHQPLERRKKFKCSLCNFKCLTKYELSHHKAKKHKKVNITSHCPKCPASFSSGINLKYHISSVHNFRTCPACASHISTSRFVDHLKIRVCKYCKSEFDCQGLHRNHKQKCKHSKKCSTCFKAFYSYSTLKRHVLNHHVVENRIVKNEKRRPKCKFCFKYFLSIGCLNNHLRTMHAVEGIYKFQCAHCSKKFVSKQSMKMHFIVVHSLLEKKHDCNHCERKFHLLYQLKKHAKSHLRMECEICKMEVKPGSLIDHIRTWHDKILHELECAHCSKKFTCKGGVERHLAVVHNLIGKKHACKQCKKKFYFLNELKRHESSHSIERVKCKICEIELKENSLKWHIRSLHNVKKLHVFECAHCSKKFTCKGSVERHLAAVHNLIGKKHSCKQCKKKFYFLNELKRHESSHSIERVKCKICEIELKEISLKWHIRSLHNVKKLHVFECAHCSKKFTYKVSVERHLAVVHNLMEKNHACSQCQRKFYFCYELKKHTTSKHSNKST
ncbi:zinc finger protein 11-like [Neocloeon triangulifer]|uniref:zinc finger protein 11-like n=1 Tax=Neocloeon triangulifer TaxID=2078957 RepID=UPI00286EDE3E|nr:zinc finger protein 11-like [Neocloeon triangulifer]